MKAAKVLISTDLEQVRRCEHDGRHEGFTLLELIVVLAIIGIVSSVLFMRSSTFHFWKEEGDIRKLVNLIEFLHNQAIVDQVYYHLEFDFDSKSYKVSAVRSELTEDSEQVYNEEDAHQGDLTRELAAFLNASIGSAQSLIPPPAYPSLAEPIRFDSGLFIKKIKTLRGVREESQGGTSFLLFSPRGFSDFAVLHLQLSEDRVLTILVNPFTGLTELYREEKDFEWTFGKKRTEAA